MTETITNNKAYTIFLSADILIWQKRKQVIHRKKINTNSLNEAQKNIGDHQVLSEQKKQMAKNISAHRNKNKQLNTIEKGLF